MRRFTVLALLAAACTSNSATTTTIEPLPPPPNPTNPTTTTLPTTTTVPEPIRTTYDGALPDGTTYTVFIEGAPEEEVTGFGGVVMFESESGPVVAGDTLISVLPVEGYSYANGEYRIPAGGAGSFILKFYDGVLDELGADAESIIQGAMTGSNHLGFPRLLLQPPFRWMTPEDEIPADLEVTYETFVVRRGCEDLAVACNPFHGIQVIPMERVSAPARPFEGENVFIASPALRPFSDPNYVDPGPLQGIGDPDVFWTGEHMVVWGGLFNEDDPNNQGAVLDPDTGQWRIVNGPMEVANSTGVSRALWLGDEMLSISEEGIYAGDPVKDEWSRRGNGLSLEPTQPLLAIDGDVYAWTGSGIIRIAPDGQQENLDHPGYTLQGGWHGTLLDFGGHLVASGTNCQVRRTAIWNGSGWTELETISLRACSSGDQIAVVGGELIAWSSAADATYRYNAGELDWDRFDPIPFQVTERPSGPLVVGDTLFVHHFGSAAVFDAPEGEWTIVDPPGRGLGDLMVWTGDEIFSWYFGWDAWRWTPPTAG